jgi:hypothetical protein
MTNHDHIILIALILGAIPAFLIGYAKGHQHGKIAGRIAVRRMKQYEQVGR